MITEFQLFVGRKTGNERLDRNHIWERIQSNTEILVIHELFHNIRSFQVFTLSQIPPSIKNTILKKQIKEKSNLGNILWVWNLRTTSTVSEVARSSKKHSSCGVRVWSLDGISFTGANACRGCSDWLRTSTSLRLLYILDECIWKHIFHTETIEKRREWYNNWLGHMLINSAFSAISRYQLIQNKPHNGSTANVFSCSRHLHFLKIFIFAFLLFLLLLLVFFLLSD